MNRNIQGIGSGRDGEQPRPVPMFPVTSVAPGGRPVKGCVMSDPKGKSITLADASTGRYCGICRSDAEAGVLECNWNMIIALSLTFVLMPTVLDAVPSLRFLD